MNFTWWLYICAPFVVTKQNDNTGDILIEGQEKMGRKKGIEVGEGQWGVLYGENCMSFFLHP